MKIRQNQNRATRYANQRRQRKRQRRGSVERGDMA